MNFSLSTVPRRCWSFDQQPFNQQVVGENTNNGGGETHTQAILSCVGINIYSKHLTIKALSSNSR